MSSVTPRKHALLKGRPCPWVLIAIVIFISFPFSLHSAPPSKTQKAISKEVLRLATQSPDPHKAQANANIAKGVQKLAQEDVTKKAPELTEKNREAVHQKNSRDFEEQQAKYEKEIQAQYYKFMSDAQKNLPQRTKHHDYSAINQSFKPITRKR
ncbi:hypothetical protein WDW89_17195 [Deltaproteobacteria bacterium TL4]